jgi:hypothetical protein
VLLTKERIDDVSRLAMYPIEDFGIEGGDTLGGLGQAFPVRILAQGLDYLANRLLDPAPINLIHTREVTGAGNIGLNGLTKTPL